jgi:hypothetical protein
MLDIHHYSLLYTPCWPSKLFASAQGDHTSERERVSCFYHFTPTISRKSVCGKFLITSILVLLFSLEVPWKKYQKNTAKNKKERGKKTRRQHRRGVVCVFFSFVRRCFVITLVSRLMSLAQSNLGSAYYCH